MTKIPEPTTTIASLIDDSHAERPEKPRPHMGASQLGHHCERWLWLSFRWAVKEKFPGRILRLFRRGQNEEESIVADLRRIGVDIKDTDEEGKQFRVNFGHHVSGSMDGLIKSGVPEATKKEHILEAKTHSKKSFDDLVKKGVEKSKPMHYVQCQVYMYGEGVDRALYYAVCKDNDRIHTERVRLDEAVAERYIERGKRIAVSDRMPEPCPGSAPDWYQCRFCPAHSFCHDTHRTDKINCRTCAHYTALPDSTSHCSRWDDKIPVPAQHEGCPSHVMHPDMVPWKMRGGDGINGHYTINGVDVINGEGGLSSAMLIASSSEQ